MASGVLGDRPSPLPAAEALDLMTPRMAPSPCHPQEVGTAASLLLKYHSPPSGTGQR